MTKKTFCALLIAVLFLGNVVLFGVFLRSPGPGKRGGGPKEIVIEKLHFNPEQVEKYEVLIKAHRSRVSAADEKINALKAEMYLQLKGNPNMQIVDSLLHEISLVQAGVEAIHFEHFLEIKAICTPAQLDDFNRLTDEIGRFFTPPGPPPRE